MPTKTSITGPAMSQGLPVAYRIRERTWENTPNYRTVQANGTMLPINNYLDSLREPSQVIATNTTWNAVTGVQIATGPVGYSTVDALLARHNALSAWGSVTETSDSILTNEAALKALSKVSDAKVNVAVALAEAKKTSDLILSTANKLLRAYRAFKRRRFSDVAKILGIHWKNVHSTWLQYKYGWMPLIMDVKNSAEFFAQQVVGRPLRFSVTGTATSNDARSEKTFDPTYMPGSYYIEEATSAKTMKVKLWCEITNPHLTAIQQLGLTNPAEVVWELTPFSFVFDWFISVGDWLKGLTALIGVSVRRAMVSRVKDLTVSYTSVALSGVKTGTRYSGYTFKYTSKGRSYSRNPYTVNPLSLHPPVNRDPFSFGRLITGLALVRNQARRLN